MDGDKSGFDKDISSESGLVSYKPLQNMSKDDIISGMERQDVTSEYFQTATQGQGLIIYDEKYDIDSHQEEVKMARWIHNTFGGDIRLLTEINEQMIKTADFLWREKLWDLKTVTTEKAANFAIRKGLK